VVVNRLMETLPDAAELEHARLPAALKRKLQRNLADFKALKQRELIALDALRANLPSEVPIFTAGELSREPRTLKELAAVAAGLAGNSCWAPCAFSDENIEVLRR
jgi:hypothetical protein